MGVMTARLLFLAFLGLTGTIIYNALYLQEHGQHDVASVPAATTMVRKVETETITVERRQRAPTAASGQSGPVTTDLPPLSADAGESQLIVRAVQRELATRGYDVGAVDGQLSNQTRAAISAFQKKEGLPVTGAPSDELLRQILLGDSVAVSGATGSVGAADSIAVNAAEHETVMRVQQVLADLGYAPGPVDGAWGENTSHAISAFQNDRNLPVTGQITPELLDEFQRVTGRDLTKTAARP
jgi:peptidoglycan hydrolase-like protein with peptidoglycan-binding domain